MSIVLELKQEENIKGEIWFHIYENGISIKCFVAAAENKEQILKDATDCYNAMLDRLAAGFPKEETIFTHTF